jgi:hypothetical protein
MTELRPSAPTTGVVGAMTTSVVPPTLLQLDIVRQTAASITTGHAYSLGIPIQQCDVPLIEYRGTPMRLTLQDSADDGTVLPRWAARPAPAPTRSFW